MKNLLVYRSSAGSGKTFTLVKQYLIFILKDANPGMYKHVLAITFTNKATAEMKDRVLKNLQEISEGKNKVLIDLLSEELKLSKSTLKNRAKENLNHIIHNYSDLSILTIDKFIYKIAKSFALELDFAPNVNVDLDQNKIIELAVSPVIEAIGTDLNLQEITLEYLNNLSDQKAGFNLEKNITSLAHLLLDEKTFNYVKSNQKTFTTNVFFQTLKRISSHKNHFEKTRLIHLKEIHQHIKQTPFSSLKGGSRTSIKSWIEKQLTLENNIKFSDFQIKSYIQKMMQTESFVNAKTNTEFTQEITEHTHEILEALKALENLIEQKGQTYALFNLIEKTMFPMFLMGLIQKQLALVYQKENRVHLSEFSKKIAHIVNTEPIPFVYERVGERYHHYLLDEFQDTSSLQFFNMLPLVSEALSRNNQNLLVGDSKQAIYRWRGSELMQFANLPNLEQNSFHATYQSEHQPTIAHNFKASVLGFNYRSAQNIVSFNNTLFKGLKTHLIDRFKPLYKDHEQIAKSNDKGYVCIEKQAQENKEDFSHIAQKIHECLDDGYLLNEITILSRSNSRLVKISDFLTSQNIAVQSSESLLIKNDARVIQLLLFLAWYIDQHSKEAKLKLLNVLDLNLSTHQTIKLLQKDQSLYNFLDQRYNISSVFSEKDSLYALCSALKTQLTSNEEQSAYVDHFLSIVHHYEIKYSSNIQGFLTFFTEQQDRFSLQGSDEKQAVKLMTIHKSKGLEFKVVIIESIDFKSTNASKTSYKWVQNTLQDFKEIAYWLVPLSKELEHTIYSDAYIEESQKNLVDNLNLIYVAFTRPVDRLYGFYSSEKDGLMPLMLPILNEHFQTSEQQFTLGDLEKTNSSSVSHQAHKIAPYEKVEDFKSKISLSYAYQKESLIQKTANGTLIHTLLEQIIEPQDISKVCQLALARGLFLKHELPLIEQKLQQIISHPDLKEGYQDHVKAKNEVTLVNNKQELMRIDRLVYFKDKVQVIDFKTGKPEQKHKKQVIKYKQALSEIGHVNIQAMLFYTESLEVVFVS